MPPVSMTRSLRPFHSASPYKRSRVMPGSSPTMARRDPTSRLNRVDFPTLGRPTMARVTSFGALAGRGIGSLFGDLVRLTGSRGGQHPNSYYMDYPFRRVFSVTNRFIGRARSVAVSILRPGRSAGAHASRIRIPARAVADG